MKYEEEEINRIQMKKIKAEEQLIILKNNLEVENKKKAGNDLYNERV